MRLSKSFVPTLKEVPNDAVVKSHILMLRSGMIRMVSAGIYSFLPLGYIVIKKISEIIREEMNFIGGQEFHLPALNPRELWEKTNRVESFSDNLFIVKNRDYVLAPAHEEIMTFHARNVLKSYKELPQIWYQIQTKFRNEEKPGNGIIRSREFLIAGSTSFNATLEQLDNSNKLHEKAFRKILDRCGIDYSTVSESSDVMGNAGSERYLVKSDAGENTIAFCKHCGYTANVKAAVSKVNVKQRDDHNEIVKEIPTPDVRTINELCDFLKIDETQCAKSRVYIYRDKPILILMLGNDEVNEQKLERFLGATIRPAHQEELKNITGADAGSIGPIGFNGRIIADNRLKNSNNLFSGANKNDYHLGGIDLSRDVKNIGYADLHIVKPGEICSNCENKLEVFNAIELGYIIKNGTKYSKAMGAMFLDENGSENPLIMGSYGISIERVIACFIEQNNDEKGIIWNKTLAPFQIHLIGLNMKKEIIAEACENIYKELQEAGYDVLFDDRLDAQAGFKFNDADLLGMPIQIIVGDKKLKDNKVEVKWRKSGERFDVEIATLKESINRLLQQADEIK